MELQGWENILYDKLNELGDTIIAEMAAIIKGKGAVASGNLINSLKHEVIFENGQFELAIEYADYGKFVNLGRNPSAKFPPMADIKTWMSLKGIPQEALWPIMVKIKRGGFYSKKVGMLKGKVDGRDKQQTIYSRPVGIHFTSPFETNLDLRKILNDFEGTVAATIQKELIDDFIKNKERK